MAHQHVRSLRGKGAFGFLKVLSSCCNNNNERKQQWHQQCNNKATLNNQWAEGKKTAAIQGAGMINTAEAHINMHIICIPGLDEIC